MRHLGLALLLGAVSLAPGCHFYFGGDDDGDDDCYATDDFIAELNLRNPETGQCEYQGGGCGDIAAGDSARPAIFLDWATCNGPCDGLDEQTCMVSDACRAIYVENESCGPDGMCGWVQQYSGCWGTAPSGPVRGGQCEGLDSYTCSQHDDCSAVHQSAGGNAAGNFSACQTENLPCGSNGGVPWPGTQLRDPQTGQCIDFGGGGCLPGDSADPLAWPDWGFCESFCTGLDEASCQAADGCRGIYANVCPPNADCYSVQFTECWQTAMSGPVRGGDCTVLDAYECSRHDDCTAEHGNDWSHCMDFANCDPVVTDFISCNAEGDVPPPPPPPPPPAPVCSDIADEATCIDMTDGCITWADGQESCGNACQPFYEGSDCSCDPNGCSCSTWTFVDCA